MGMMTVTTTRFGDIEIDGDLVVTFVEPILGFDSLSRYVILDHSENSPFKWLQSIESPDLAFVITNPKLFGVDYEFVLPQPVADQLEIHIPEDALVLTIVNIPHDNPKEMTANLLGPIIINQHTKRALQVVLSDSNFSAKTRLIPAQQGASSVSADRVD